MKVCAEGSRARGDEPFGHTTAVLDGTRAIRHSGMAHDQKASRWRSAGAGICPNKAQAARKAGSGSRASTGAAASDLLSFRPFASKTRGTCA